jgi:DNA-entry nuclease
MRYLKQVFLDDRTVKKRISTAFFAFFISLFLLSGCAGDVSQAEDSTQTSSLENTSSPAIEIVTSESERTLDFADIPDYSGEAYIELNNNMPQFSADELTAQDGTEEYGALDSLGRATSAFAILCENTRPKPGSKRNTNMPNPSGWVQAYYPEIGLDHLYERSHLIAYSLSDEAINPCDLITGTEQLNQEAMSLFEQKIRDYLDQEDGTPEHDKHVIMRVTPDFRDEELIARGVQIEAFSVDDAGASICFNVYCYNAQPGIIIDYATGESHLAEATQQSQASETTIQGAEISYVLNTNTKKFHYPDCRSATEMKAKNRQEVTASRESLIDQGYQPCARCKP